MRQIGTLANQQLARRFTDFLTTQGIAAVAEEESDAWSIWVRDEDHVEKSRDVLDQFRADPNREQYVNATVEAQKKREAAAREQREMAKKRVEMREVWNQPLTKRAPLMATLMGLTFVVVLLSGFQIDNSSPFTAALGFFDPAHYQDPQWQTTQDPFVDIKRGEVWRLLTPIFLHEGLLHFVFNMYWLYSLGGLIEIRHGATRLALITVIAGISGNVGEMQFTGAVGLGGMSGVVYGLMGYLWIRMILVPQERLILRREVIIILLAVLLLGFAGVLPENVANYAHLFGMLGGMAVAYVVSWFPQLDGPRRR